MQLTNYMMEKRSLSTENTGMDVTRMQIQKSLVLNPDLSSQLFRVSAVATWSTSSIKFSIYSVNNQGVKTVDHATCTVNISPAKIWISEWKRNAYLIQSRIEALRKSVEHSEAHRMKRAIVYRLFANIVEYDPDYQGMREVILNSEDLEAVSTVKFEVGDQGFYFNPKWMDSLGGVAGFIMNGNDSPHPKAEVFINHGWDGFKFISRFQPGKTYHSYNRMQLREGTLYAGDTYIFDGDEIVAVIEQIQVCQIGSRLGYFLIILVLGGSASSSGWSEADVQVKSEASSSIQEYGTSCPNSKVGGKEALPVFNTFTVRPICF
jgi:naphtho-gamma-pyrone polyketide synthase